MEGRRWGMPDGPAQRALKELEEQNEVKLGDAFLVRIPQLEGKISMRTVGPHQTYVDYIYVSWYDQERKQMRNRKKVIGQVIESIPGAMLPNENYYKYFDRRTGNLTEIGAAPGPDTGDSSGVRLDTSPDAQNRPRVRSRPTENLTEETGSVPRGQSSRYATGAYRADSPLDTPEPVKPDMSELKEEEEDNTMTERQEMIRNVMEEKKKTRILLDLLTSMRDVVREHARKRPEDVMPLYQVEKINPVLEKIRKMEAELGYGEMLEVIPRPRSRFVDGETVLEGMSYGDAEMLLECYNSVMWFTREELIEKPARSEELKEES